jgi:hypothetical protein
VGNFFGPIGSGGSGGSGGVGTGVVSTTLPAGVTANYAGITAATGVAELAANASGSTLNGMKAGFNGQWVIIVNTGSGLLQLPSAAGSPAADSFAATGGGTLNLPPGDRAIAVWLTALDAWSIG